MFKNFFKFAKLLFKRIFKLAKENPKETRFFLVIIFILLWSALFVHLSLGTLWRNRLIDSFAVDHKIYCKAPGSCSYSPESHEFPSEKVSAFVRQNENASTWLQFIGLSKNDDFELCGYSSRNISSHIEFIFEDGTSEAIFTETPNKCFNPKGRRILQIKHKGSYNDKISEMVHKITAYPMSIQTSPISFFSMKVDLTHRYPRSFIFATYLLSLFLSINLIASLIQICEWLQKD